MENEKVVTNGTMDDFMEDIEKTVKKIYPGDIVKGKVISVTDDEVLVNIGFYADGIITKSEYVFDTGVDLKTVATPDEVIDVMVVQVSDEDGNVILSKNQAEQVVVWDELDTIAKEEKVLDLTVKEAVKGGVIAFYKGVRGFIPASQLSVNYVEDLGQYVGSPIKVRLIEFNKEDKKVIFSHKVIEQEERAKKKEALLNQLQKGQEFTGTVKRLAKFGAFVDIGGVDGLIRIGDLSWKRIKHPSEVLKEGEKVDVYIIDFNKEEGKIGLGLRNVEANPWEQVDEKYKVGDVVVGKVVRLAGFGAFVELEPGIEGLVHISQISDERVTKVEDKLEDGQEVKVKVVSLDKPAHKLGLSIREAIAEQAKLDIPEEYRTEQEIGTNLGSIFGNIKFDE